MGKRFAERNQLDPSQVNKDVLKEWDENDVFAKSVTERERERELKVVDCINDFFHAPYACIAFDFLQFLQLLSFSKWKQQPVFHKLLHKKYQCHFTG